MSTAELIRRRLEAGETPGAISKGLGVTKNRVYCIRWRSENPDYHRTYMQRYRDCHPAYEQRQALQRKIRAVRERRAGEAQRVQMALAPAHWYG